MDPIIIPPGTEYGEAIRLLQTGLNQLIGEVANKAPARLSPDEVKAVGREVSKQLAQDLRRQERPWRP